jgi:hypothetical protein
MGMQMQMRQFDDDDDDIPWKPKATTEEICNLGIDVKGKCKPLMPKNSNNANLYPFNLMQSKSPMNPLLLLRFRCHGLLDL